MRGAKDKRWWGYVLYGLLLAALLLYLRFPSETLKDYLEQRAEGAHSSLHLSIGRLSPALPLGLKLLKTEVLQGTRPRKILFHSERLYLRPAIGSLLRGRQEFCFEGLAYEGFIKGCAQLDRGGPEAPLVTSVALKDIRLEKYDLRRLIGRHVEGTLNGTLAYRGKQNLLMDGSGEAALRLTDGTLQLLQPILTLEAIDFDEVSIKLLLKNRRINLTRVELRGPNMRGTLSGLVMLNKDLAQSGLDLRGTIEPFANFFTSLPGTRDTVKLFKQRLRRGTLSFIIRGTLSEPRIQFT